MRLLPAGLLCLAAVAALGLLPGPAAAHAGTGAAAFTASGVLEAEDYTSPYAMGCDPTGDSEHTQVNADGGASGGFHAFIPNDNCGLEFPKLSFPTSGKFTSYRAYIGGTTATRTYEVTLFVDGVAAAKASFTQSGAPVYVDVAFPASSATVSAGVHDLRLDAQVIAGGSGWYNLHVDCILYNSPPGGSCASPPPPPDKPPVPAFDFDNSLTGCEDSTIKFADASTDDGKVVEWLWEFGDGNIAKDPDPTHVYAVAGTYTVRLTVTDDEGNVATTSGLVASVGDPDCCPSLDDPGDVEVFEGVAIRFDLRVDDFEGGPFTYSWDGDLPAGADAAMSPAGSFTWKPAAGHAGTYALRFTVSDGQCSDTQDAFVRVEAFPPSEPAPDTDTDGVADPSDNCPSTINRDQADADRDGLGDACDPEPGAAAAPAPHAPASRPRPAAEGGGDGCVGARPDADLDGLGDRCDLDADGDGIPERGADTGFMDNCPGVRNDGQADADADGLGDACDTPEGGASAAWAAPARPAAAAAGDEAASGRLPLVLGGAVLGGCLALLAGLLAVGLRRRPPQGGGSP